MYTFHCLPNEAAARGCYEAVARGCYEGVSVGGVRHLSADAVFEEVRYFIAQGRSVKLKATGSSMRPTICNLDVVEICPVERGAIRRYHVVLAQLADGRYVIHRVVRIVRSGGGDGGLVFVLMGDANLVQREMCGYENIIGRVRVGGGFFLGFLRPLRLAVAVVLKYKLKFLKS